MNVFAIYCTSLYSGVFTGGSNAQAKWDHTTHVCDTYMKLQTTIIKLVDSLCRNGTDMLLVKLVF